MESGYWRVSVARAQALIGHPIHFHRRQAEPAFLSGTVTDFRREDYTAPSGHTSPRTVFLFTPGETNSGEPVAAGPGGWTPAGVKFIP